MNPYESDRLLNEYLLFHFGADSEVLTHGGGPREALGYPERCVSEGVDLGKAFGGRALDLGCAVGRSSFELARHCGEVIGIDYSHRFVEAAERIRSQGQVSYWRRDEGDLQTPLVARLPEGVLPDRIRFEQGDAMNLRSDLGVFDVVLMANLIDRLVDPRKCLSALFDLLRPGGQLVITSPYTWMEEYTPRQSWLGGFEREGEKCSTLDGLKEVLGGGFEIVRTIDLPFLIREHARKYQWSVAEGSIWIRR